MSVVVTGASGFVGGALVRELLRRGVETIPTARHRPKNRLAGATIVRNYDDTPLGDILVHLAESPSATDADEARIEPVTDLFAHLLNKKYSRTLYVSSALVYGDVSPHPHRPEEAPAPGGPYARAKLACEQMTLRSGGVVARLANLYGPGMASNNVVSDILRQIPGRGPLRLRDDAPVRDFLWIEDAARGLADMALGTSSDVFNLGSGTSVSVGEVARLALDIAGQSDRRVVATQPSRKVSSLSLDISATTSTFGWSPRVPLSRGLASLLRRESWPSA